ncbi:MAG: hypothetical protein IKU60_06120 [Clostridia bacterium]|nr:hypothetical protein [Clostridia bacterium]
MDKIKRFLTLPLFWHGGLLIAFAVLNGKAAGMSLITVDVLSGLIVTPVFMAVLSVAHAIVHEGKVYDYIYSALTILVATGIMRTVVYSAFGGGKAGLLLALGVMVISVGVFTLWDCIFALTDRIMKRKPNHKRK